MYGIEDELTAFYFDRAVRLFGQSMSNAIEEATRGAKTDAKAQFQAQQVIDKWLGLNNPGKFRTPTVGAVR